MSFLNSSSGSTLSNYSSFFLFSVSWMSLSLTIIWASLERKISSKLGIFSLYLTSERYNIISTTALILSKDSKISFSKERELSVTNLDSVFSVCWVSIDSSNFCLDTSWYFFLLKKELISYFSFFTYFLLRYS